MNDNEKCHKVRQISFVFSCVKVVPTGTGTIKAWTPSSHAKRFPIFISLSFSLSPYCLAWSRKQNIFCIL